MGLDGSKRTSHNSVYTQTLPSVAGLRSARSATLPTPHSGTFGSSGLASQALISCCQTSYTLRTLGEIALNFSLAIAEGNW